MPETVMIFGIDLQVLAILDEGIYLVAHPNGPAIATKTSMRTLEPFDDDDSSATRLVARAISKYTELTWPLLWERLKAEEE